MSGTYDPLHAVRYSPLHYRRHIKATINSNYSRIIPRNPFPVPMSSNTTNSNDGSAHPTSSTVIDVAPSTESEKKQKRTIPLLNDAGVPLFGKEKMVIVPGKAFGYRYSVTNADGGLFIFKLPGCTLDRGFGTKYSTFDVVLNDESASTIRRIRSDLIGFQFANQKAFFGATKVRRRCLFVPS